MATLPTFVLPALSESVKKNITPIKFEVLTEHCVFGTLVLASDKLSDFSLEGGEPSVGFLHGFKVSHDGTRNYDVYFPHRGTTLPYRHIAQVYYTDAPMVIGRQSNSEVYSGNLVGLQRLTDDRLVCKIQCIETRNTKEVSADDVVFVKDIKFGLVNGVVDEAKQV